MILDKNYYNDEIYDLIVNQRIGRYKLMEYLQIGEKRARTIINYYKSLKENKENNSEEKIMDNIEIYKVDPEKIIDEAIHRQKFNNEIEPIDNSLEATVELNETSDGIAEFLAIGDIHFGNAWTDYESLSLVYKLIKMKNYNVVFLGDQRESFIREIKGNYIPVLSQILTPQQQLIWAVNTYRELIERKQLKLIVEGNHDKRSHLVTGQNYMNLINWNVPIKHNRCYLTVKFKGREWKGVLVHKEQWGGAQFNATNGGSKGLRMKYPWADFIVTAHTHVPGYQEVAYNGKLVPIIQIGCFDYNADYALTAYGSNSFIYYPVLKFDPDLPTPLYDRGFYFK